MTTAPEPGTFPREMSLAEATADALDTDAMLAELNDLVTPSDDQAPEVGSPSDGAPSDDPPAGDGEDDPSATEPTPQTVPPGMIEFEGELLPVDEVRQLLALNARLKADPEAAQRIAAAARAPKVDGTTPPALPDFIDPDDHATVALYTEVQALKAENARRAQAEANGAEATRRTQVVDSFRSAVANFKVQHPNLTDDDIRQVADATGKANIVEGLERSTGSLTLAFERGMEMTMWGDTELRSLAVADNAGTVAKKAADRKSKSSALTGGGGSVSKSTAPPKVPKTRDELMAAMLQDVRSDPTLSS